MKILHLFPYLPTPPTFGGALRIYHILKYLSEHHDVTVSGFTEYGDPELFVETFPELKDKMHFINRPRVKHPRLLQFYSLFTGHSYWYNRVKSKELVDTIESLVSDGSYDLVLSEFASMGHFDLQTPVTRIVDAHNVEYDNFRRMGTLEWSWIRKKFFQREYRKSYVEEIKTFKRHDAIFVTSERDGNLIKKDVPEVPQFVIPNGVDTDYFSPSKVEIEPFSMVFTGAMGYVPNYDGILYFLKKIFPVIKRRIPEAKIYIVGGNPPQDLLKHQSKSVIVTGFVEDVRPYIDQASVFVVPLKMGSGTRLKVVEALSMQKPVVTTSIGCEGIEVEDGNHLLIRDEPKEFAEAVMNLFENEKLRQKLVGNGYELVKEKYDWRIIGKSIEKAFDELLQTKQKTVPKNVRVKI